MKFIILQGDIARKKSLCICYTRAKKN